MPDERSSASEHNPPIIVIFGITGDLAQRYLLPALYHLIKDRLLDPQAEIIGITRRDVSADQLFEQVELCVNEADKVCDPAALKSIRSRTRMIKMDLDDEHAYIELRQTLDSIEEQKGICMNRLYYLSIPPQVYRPIIGYMGAARLNTSCQHNQAVTRLLVEKPFGFDLSSAEELINETGSVFDEAQIFRIDHFLAKEMVQNIVAFRFENPWLETWWNHKTITSIEISAAEQITIEGRAKFYDQVGALRDFIQNHLLQLLAIITMEQPEQLDSDHIHAAKAALLQDIRPMREDEVSAKAVRGQYRGYPDEVGDPSTTTETYAGLALQIDNPRWQGTLISLWTGKAMESKKYEITLYFQDDGAGRMSSLHFRIQPDGGIRLDLQGQPLAFSKQLRELAARYAPKQSTNRHKHPDAYERVFVGAVSGDHTLFATSEEVLASWRIIQPVLAAWQNTSSDLQTYEPGAKGPLSASAAGKTIA